MKPRVESQMEKRQRVAAEVEIARALETAVAKFRAGDDSALDRHIEALQVHYAERHLAVDPEAQSAEVYQVMSAGDIAVYRVLGNLRASLRDPGKRVSEKEHELAEIDAALRKAQERGHGVASQV